MRRQGFGIDYKLGRRTAAQHAGTSEFADRILSLPQMKTEGRSMDMFNRTALRALWVCLTLTLAPAMACRADDERQSLEELRNTVVNLLQALVDQGVISREKAQQMVKAAQDKAAKQIAEEVKPGVVADVVKEAQTEKWGVPGALPDWLTRIRVSGDVLLREEGIFYAGENA